MTTFVIFHGGRLDVEVAPSLLEIQVACAGKATFLPVPKFPAVTINPPSSATSKMN